MREYVHLHARSGTTQFKLICKLIIWVGSTSGYSINEWSPSQPIYNTCSSSKDIPIVSLILLIQCISCLLFPQPSLFLHYFWSHHMPKVHSECFCLLVTVKNSLYLVWECLALLKEQLYLCLCLPLLYLF